MSFCFLLAQEQSASSLVGGSSENIYLTVNKYDEIYPEEKILDANDSIQGENINEDESLINLAKIDLEFIDITFTAPTVIASEQDFYDHNFSIGKDNITIKQYCAFLNAVATTDTYHLYHENMGSSLGAASIVRLGSPGEYYYSVREIEQGGGDLPVTHITWFDAARFCNWMHHDQPVGVQDDMSTENGAYCLHDEASGFISMNEDARYFLPNEAQWNNALHDKKLAAVFKTSQERFSVWSNTFDSETSCLVIDLSQTSLACDDSSNQKKCDPSMASNVIGFRLASRVLSEDGSSLVKKPTSSSNDGNDYCSAIHLKPYFSVTDWKTGLTAAGIIAIMASLVFMISYYIGYPQIALSIAVSITAPLLRALREKTKFSTAELVSLYCILPIVEGVVATGICCFAAPDAAVVMAIREGLSLPCFGLDISHPFMAAAARVFLQFSIPISIAWFFGLM
ncbi:MAG TPA: SUMF1/EgtB/PvdO family nonheme iron enzyme [Chthoniobacterales bacterium]|nr:SUMF1/EgtB/PvdO family nonheme iron enzyme [Chthoniobacterales bacterium]